MIAVTFLSETRLPILFYIACYVGWFGYLYLLLKSKNEFLKGLPFVVVNFGAALALLQKGEYYYLRIITFSLPSLPIYSVQGFPPIFVFLMGAGHFLLYQEYLPYLEAFYEPITSSYRIPAISLENTLKGFRVGLYLEMVCLMIYQIVVQRIWRNYQKTKVNLEETHQKLQTANLQLEKNIEELARRNTQLQEALHSQDLFVACVSHELRNPLNVMLGSLDLLEPHIKDDTTQLQLLKTCKICGEALLSQINNLLDVAKINADKLEISEFATNMPVLLERFWSFTRIGLDKKGLFGYLAVDRQLPLWLNIDAHRLHQILNNLVGNAIKFTGEGSIRINFQWMKDIQNAQSYNSIVEKSRERLSTSIEDSRMRTDSSETADMNEGERQETYFSKDFQKRNTPSNFICFKSHQPIKDTLEDTLATYDDSQVNYLKIDIVDTGCGISDEAQKTIFQPFVQGDRSVTRKYGGTGLGLYIAKSLVTKMGGNMKISSLKDVGTRFQIVLPVKSIKGVNGAKNEDNNQRISELQPHSPTTLKSVVVIKDSPREDTHAPKQSRRVLIVDDDSFNRNLLKEYFKQLNFQYDEATNGLEGLQMYQRNVQRYSFITMDIQMPLMDGITACQKIREYEKEIGKSKIPIIIITGNCSENEQRTCLKIESSYFFRKPFRLADCKLCIDRMGFTT